MTDESDGKSSQSEPSLPTNDLPILVYQEHPQPLHVPRPALTDDDTVTAAQIPASNNTDDDLDTFQHEVAQYYKIESTIDSGGMGVVYKAKDLTFGREVAIKKAKSKFKNRPNAHLRFVEEARITAQLQHPNIPPVYHLGTLKDGRHYLVMKFIEGITLDKLMKQRTHFDLSLFLSICKCVAYAHSRNVLHRDLKPANIMIGLHGIVYVMDWGIAKLIQSDDYVFNSALKDQKKSGEIELGPVQHDATTQGSVVGTPSYMPPEQAQGKLDAISARSDVFGLGAILCAMLTGKPVYVAKLGEQVTDLAKSADLRGCYRRLDESNAQPELIEICKKCLSAAPDARYADAGELADAIEKLQQTQQEKIKNLEFVLAANEIKTTEQKRRKRIQLISAVSIVLTLMIGLIGTFIGLVRARENAALAQKAAIDEQFARRAAIESSELARARSLDLIQATTNVVFTLQEQLERLPGSLQTRKDLLEDAAKSLEKVVAELADDDKPSDVIIWARIKLADIYLQNGQVQKAEEQYTNAYSEATKIYEKQPNHQKARKNLIECLLRIGNYKHNYISKPQEAMQNYLEAIKLLYDSNELSFEDIETQRLNIKLRHGIAICNTKLGKYTAAKDEYEYARSCYLKLVSQPDAKVQDKLDYVDTLISYSKLYRVLGQADDGILFLKNLIGQIKQYQSIHKGDYRFERRLVSAISCIGDIQYIEGNYEEALQKFEEAKEINLNIITKDPDNKFYQRSVCVYTEKVADVYFAMKQHSSAMHEYASSLRLRRKLFEDDPADHSLKRDLAAVISKIAMTSQYLRNYELTRDYYLESINLFSELHHDSNRSLYTDRDLLLAKLPYAIYEFHNAEFYTAAKCFEELDASLIRIKQLSDGLGDDGTIGLERLKILSDDIAEYLETVHAFIEAIEDLNSLWSVSVWTNRHLIQARFKYFLKKSDDAELIATMLFCKNSTLYQPEYLLNEATLYACYTPYAKTEDERRNCIYACVSCLDEYRSLYSNRSVRLLLQWIDESDFDSVRDTMLFKMFQAKLQQIRSEN